MNMDSPRPPQPRGEHMPAPACPHWCVTRHGYLQDEEDWVHMSAPLAVTGQESARLCVTVHPDGTQEDPVLLIGAEEYTVEEAAALGAAILDLATAGRKLTARATA